MLMLNSFRVRDIRGVRTQSNELYGKVARPWRVEKVMWGVPKLQS